MPKATFYNLSDEKKEVILEALKKEFEENSIFEASVSSIIKRAKISRGSFYQYFEDLEDSFFTILEIEVVEIHDIFMKLIEQEKGNIFSALKLYGEVVADEIFKREKYNLYKNRYLYWTCELDAQWRKFRENGNGVHSGHFIFPGNQTRAGEEVMHYIKAIIKKLLERLFTEEWNKEEFLNHYDQYVYWMEHGLGEKEELYGTI